MDLHGTMDSVPAGFHPPSPHFWSEAKMQWSQFFAHRLELHLRWISWSRRLNNGAGMPPTGPLSTITTALETNKNRTEVLSYYSMLKLHLILFWCFFATQLKHMLVKTGNHFCRGKHTKCLKPPASNLASLQNSLNILLMSTVLRKKHNICTPRA